MALGLSPQYFTFKIWATQPASHLGEKIPKNPSVCVWNSALRVGACCVLVCVSPMCLCDLPDTQKQSNEKKREGLRTESQIKAAALRLSGGHSPHYSHVRHTQKHFSTSEVSCIHSRNAVTLFLGTHFQFSRKKTNRKQSKRSYLINCE